MYQKSKSISEVVTSKVTYLHNYLPANVASSSKDSIQEFATKNAPELPVYFFRPQSVKKATSFFKQNFRFNYHKSRILYSVKSNPDQETLKLLFSNGIKEFDVASLNEVKLISQLFGDDVKMYFMHPVKSIQAISKAYFEYGVRDFSLDSSEELNKIVSATKNAKDLNLHVRLAIPRSNAAIELSTKFGILPSHSIGLIRKSRNFAKKLGICFHVGSQCMDPIEYRKAIMIASDCIKTSSVKIDVLDIGGGFPSIYPTFRPPKLVNYFEEIIDSINSINLDKDCEIWCEPGRALVTESTSLLVKVELRKDNNLYINDGTYGGLFDAGTPEFTYPCRAIRVNNKSKLESEMDSFSFFGPTCDSIDFMKGPFYLPKNIKTGDYIEIYQLGSYSKTMRTNFNGFADYLQVQINEDLHFSIFDEDCEVNDAISILRPLL